MYKSSILFYVIGNCCYVVVVRQEFRKKFLPKCVRWHTLFCRKINSITSLALTKKARFFLYTLFIERQGNNL